MKEVNKMLTNVEVRAIRSFLFKAIALISFLLVCSFSAHAVEIEADKVTEVKLTEAQIQALPSFGTYESLLMLVDSFSAVADREWMQVSVKTACRPENSMVVYDKEEGRMAKYLLPGREYYVIEENALANVAGFRTNSVNSLIGILYPDYEAEITLTATTIAVRFCHSGLRFNPGTAVAESAYPASEYETIMSNGFLIPNDTKVSVDGKSRKIGRTSGRKELGFILVTMDRGEGLDIDIRDFEILNQLIVGKNKLTSGENDWWVLDCQHEIADTRHLGLLIVDYENGETVNKVLAGKQYFVIPSYRFDEPTAKELRFDINSPAFFVRPTNWTSTERAAAMGYRKPYREQREDESDEEYAKDTYETPWVEDESYIINDFRTHDDGTCSFKVYVHTDHVFLPREVLKVEGTNLADEHGKKIFGWKSTDEEVSRLIKADSGNRIGLVTIIARHLSVEDLVALGTSDDIDSGERSVSLEIDSDDDATASQDWETFIQAAKKLSDDGLSLEDALTLATFDAENASAEQAGENVKGCNGGGFGFKALALTLLALGFLRIRK